ncbi:MAG: hypothetical protein ACO1OC_13355 [Tuberibacillus sp.]
MLRILTGFGMALLTMIFIPMIWLFGHYHLKTVELVLWMASNASPYIVIAVGLMSFMERFYTIKNFILRSIAYGAAGGIVSFVAEYYLYEMAVNDITIIYTVYGFIGLIGYLIGRTCINSFRWQKTISLVVPVAYVIFKILADNLEIYHF